MQAESPITRAPNDRYQGRGKMGSGSIANVCFWHRSPTKLALDGTSAAPTLAAMGPARLAHLLYGYERTVR